MKKKNIAAFIVTMFSALFIFLTASCAKIPEQNWKSYFPLKVGNEWTYEFKRDGQLLDEPVYKITGQEKIRNVDTFIKDTTFKNKVHLLYFLEASDNGVYCHRKSQKIGDAQGNSIEFDPSEPVMEFPLVKDKKWTWTVEMNSSIAVDFEGQVISEEEVTVPAGTFKAVKILTHSTKQGPISPSASSPGTKTDEQPPEEIIPTITETTWYAPGIGMVKTEMSGNKGIVVLELKSCKIDGVSYPNTDKKKS